MSEYLSQEGLEQEEQERNQQNSQLNQKYSKEDLKNALSEVSSGASVYGAAKRHNVPRTTLIRHKDNICNDTPGRKTLLDPKTEEKLADWIIECAKRGDPRTKEEVIVAASELFDLIGVWEQSQREQRMRQRISK
jgi:helix-turn-helix, Psq domain